MKKDFVCPDVTFFEQTPYYSAAGNQCSADLLNVPIENAALNPSSSPQITVPLPVDSVASPSSRLEHNEPPLQVYERRKKKNNQVQIQQPNNQSTSDSADQNPVVETDLPIALRKGTRACTQHPISHFVSFKRLP